MKRLLFLLLLIPIGLFGQRPVVSTNVSYATFVPERTYMTVLTDGNTVGWYIASDVASITKDGTDSVSVWADTLDSGHDLLATDNTPQQPIWKTPDYIQFNGVANYMAASYTWSQPCMLYVVIKQITWTYGEILIDNNTTGALYLSQLASTPGIRMDITIPSASSNDLAVNTWGIVRIYFNGASSRFNVDGHDPVTFSTAYNMGGLRLAASGTPGGWSYCAFKEVICRKVTDSAEDELLIYNYLKARYGL